MNGNAMEVDARNNIDIFLQDQAFSEEAKLWCFGPLRLWCKRIDDEIWVAFKHVDIGVGANENNSEPLKGGELPEDTTWARWVLKQKQASLQFVPVLPDRPVVVKPEYPFKIVQGAKTRVYVRVPAWICIQQPGKTPISLVEIPTMVLSKTWFGTATEGERCYWLSSPARSFIEAEPFTPFNVICPIQIVNSSDDELHVDKLALHVTGLSIFRYENQLWSDESKITYKGGGDFSRITISGKAPAGIAGAQLINSARQASSKGFTAKTFINFIEIPGFSFK